MTKPLDSHDVRQSAYRGNGPQSDETGVPDGKERRDPSLQDAPASDESLDDAGDDRSGRTQPNMGQAGTYGSGNEETDVTSKNHKGKP